MDTRPVAMTAQFTAKAREIESQRADALFNDPWAHLFSGEAGDRWLTRQKGDYPGLPLVLRTRYLDDFLAAQIHESAMAQVVFLGAGYDTRAYRLDWPPWTRLFEIDQPAVLAYKDQILQAAGAVPRCERHVIGMDIAFEWTHPLLEAGFLPDRPSLWIIEGLLMYLTLNDAAHLLATISQITPSGSRLGCDLINQVMLTSPLTQERVERMAQGGMPWQFGVEDPRQWLQPFGWMATVTTLNQAGQQYQRGMHHPVSALPSALELPQLFFISAQRE